MNKITENEIELFAIELLEKQGYEYIYTSEYKQDIDKPMNRIVNMVCYSV